MSKYRVAIDVGGTFTDVFVFNEKTGGISVTKTSSTPSEPETGILMGLEKANISGEDISMFSHGTTVGTNALIERKLPKTVLITSKGFRDVSEIRRGTKQDLWDAYKDVAPPYIKRRDRFELNERIDYAGNILEEVNEQEIRTLAQKLKKRGTESIAICFMNSYINNLNELKTMEVLAEELPDIYICASSDILPEIFEHERMSTTIINAVLGPKVSNYIQSLEQKIKTKGYKGDILVLHSGGGVMTSKTVPRYAARLASSGIAAGAIASKYIANLCGFKNAIGLDMGGTSTDISLVYNGELKITKDWYIEYGYPIGFPSIEILTIGAGGGSLAWVDEGRSLRNGPQSSGAEPGPACYQRGGDEPTNTDANLVLGRLNTEILNGQMSLDKEAAHRVVRKIGDEFGYTDGEAANAIVKVANANMCDALRLISVRKGYDPRDFALVAFGGAGALHSAYLAKEIGIPNVIVPAHPGVAAAFGCLLVDVRHDVSKTFVKSVEEVNAKELEIEFMNLEIEVTKLLRQEDIAEENMNLIRHIEMRYVGQWRTLSTPVGRPIASLESALNIFHQEYQRTYAYSNPHHSVEIYAITVEGVGVVPKPEIIKESSEGLLNDALKGYREVFFEEVGGYINTPIFDRENIPTLSELEGPAIIEQLDATVVLPPEFTAKVDEYKNIIMTIEKY